MPNFDNILNKLKSVLFTDVPQTTTAAGSSPSSAAANTTAASPPPQPLEAPVASANMVQKVHSLLDKMNMPGIDFMELWDAANAMGAVNEQTVSNAFVALKIASGNTLSKQIILQTGEQYAQQLRTALEQDVAQKQKLKQDILQQQQTALSSLTQETEGLAKQIADLQASLDAKRKELSTLQAADNPEVRDMDKKIADGSTAVQAVIAELSNMLNIAKVAIKE
jgi:hypothetical protein